MTDTCVHVGCDRLQRARRLCPMHYQQLKRQGLGDLQRKQPRKATGVVLDAQLGQNSNCVDCGQKPWSGGMRCWACFKRQCDYRAGSHTVDTPPGVSGYSAGCRCRVCRTAANEQRKTQRRRQVAA